MSSRDDARIKNAGQSNMTGNGRVTDMEEGASTALLDRGYYLTEFIYDNSLLLVMYCIKIKKN